MNRADHVYKLRWRMSTEAGRFTKDEILADKAGGCDALIISCIEQDGAYSQALWSHDGRNGGLPLPPQDEFKAWLIHAHRLARLPGLDDRRRGVVAALVEAVHEMFEEARAKATEVLPS